jgi:uncharacterized membrane protein
MAHLVVLGLDNRDDAERVFDLAGLAVGAATGRARRQAERRRHQRRRDQADRPAAAAGQAAVFVLARSATVDRVVDALKPYSPTIIQTNLTKDREEELVQALQS